jgi:hypothetical protein
MKTAIPVEKSRLNSHLGVSKHHFSQPVQASE